MGAMAVSLSPQAQLGPGLMQSRSDTAATATTPSAQFPRVKVSVPSDTWGADRAENSDGKVTR